MDSVEETGCLQRIPPCSIGLLFFSVDLCLSKEKTMPAVLIPWFPFCAWDSVVLAWCLYWRGLALELFAVSFGSEIFWKVGREGAVL